MYNSVKRNYVNSKISIEILSVNGKVDKLLICMALPCLPQFFYQIETIVTFVQHFHI